MSAVPIGWDVGFEVSQTVALRALGFIASDRRELDRFLAATGLSADDIGQHPLESRHLAAILDFLITDEEALQRFAQRMELPPETAYEARRLLGSARNEEMN